VKRIQFYLDEEVWAVLQFKARQTGVTVSELVRRAIRDSYRNPTDRRKQAMLDFIGIRKDRRDLPPTNAYVRKLRSGSKLERLSGE
jgi:Ribbon-helix-helix protein, copG family